MGILKTLNIMANFEIKFLDNLIKGDYIKVEMYEQPDSGNQSIYIEGISEGDSFAICLDKSTAIKFSKTLRTEINKIEG